MTVGAFKIAMFLIGMHRAPEAEPTCRRLKKSKEAAVFHLTTFPVGRQKAEDRIKKHHIGRNGQGKKMSDTNHRSNKKKEKHKENRIRIEAVAGHHEVFQSTGQRGIISISRRKAKGIS
jgi:hypothetical protein